MSFLLPSISRFTGATILLCAATMACAGEAGDDSPSTTPYRPSVSTPAALSAPGWIEVEIGGTHEHDPAGGRRDSIPATVKLAFTPDWGIRVGGDAWAHRRDDMTSASGIGDLGVVLKRRFEVDDAQAFGLEAQATLPSARRGVGTGSGKADIGLNAIYSADFADTWHTDLNLVGTRLGQVGALASRAQLLWAAALSRALNERWGVMGELSGTSQHDGSTSSQFLLAVTCNVAKQLTLDVGAARSLRTGTPTWSAFTGLTWLAVRLF